MEEGKEGERCLVAFLSQAAGSSQLLAPQSAQVEITLAPTAAESLPATQSVLTVEAGTPEYLLLAEQRCCNR